MLPQAKMIEIDMMYFTPLAAFFITLGNRCFPCILMECVFIQCLVIIQGTSYAIIVLPFCICNIVPCSIPLLPILIPAYIPIFVVIFFRVFVYCSVSLSFGLAGKAPSTSAFIRWSSYKFFHPSFKEVHVDFLRLSLAR